MKKNSLAILIAAMVIIAICLLIAFTLFSLRSMSESPTKKAIAKKLKDQDESFKNLKIDIIGPSEAPEGLKDLVVLGYHIMIETPTYVKGYVGDRLSCTNCHFAAGNKLGGEKNGGISLAGVAAKYPNYDERVKKVLNLPERINNCFEKSMNGKPIPLNSKEMLALETYLFWISQHYPIYEKVPWLGLPALSIQQKPNTEKGSQVYNTYCAMCHGSDGNGQRYQDNSLANVPPLWGPNSFNDAAGMNIHSILSSFIYYNMPYTDAGITEEQAIDVASFILSKPRPHFEK